MLSFYNKYTIQLINALGAYMLFFLSILSCLLFLTGAVGYWKFSTPLKDLPTLQQLESNNKI